MDDKQSRSHRSTAGFVATPLAFFGKHRMPASIAHLNNQISIIEKEIEELDTLGEASIVCKELVPSVRSLPDPLLPSSKGPAEAGWDRWFQGSNNSRSQKRWI